LASGDFTVVAGGNSCWLQEELCQPGRIWWGWDACSDQIELTESERAASEAAAGRLTGAFDDVQRARIVLYAADGLSNVQIAGLLDTSTSVVAKWRRRFCEGRVEGLADQPRTGRPCVFPGLLLFPWVGERPVHRGSGGQSRLRLSIARAIRASGV